MARLKKFVIEEVPDDILGSIYDDFALKNLKAYCSRRFKTKVCYIYTSKGEEILNMKQLECDLSDEHEKPYFIMTSKPIAM